MTSAKHPCNLKPLSPFVPAIDRDITPNQQTGRDCLAAHDGCIAQNLWTTTAIMSEPSPRPPLTLPHEFYSGHAPTLRLLGGTTAGDYELPLSYGIAAPVGRSSPPSLQPPWAVPINQPGLAERSLFETITCPKKNSHRVLLASALLPANREDLVIQRILVRHGVSRDLAALLLDDMKRAIDFFEQHPIHAIMTAKEAGGFTH